MDRSGEEHEYVGEDLLARAFAHEIDHLDGILFTDKMVERVEPDGAGENVDEQEL